jgi:hypothetical protein
MTVRVVFKVNFLPHPQVEHLGSRIRSIGKIAIYEDDKIAIDTNSPKTLIIAVKEYLKDRNVSFTYRTKKFTSR